VDYTSQVMSYLLDGTLAAYPSWRNYFDVVVVSAGKPEFFTEEHPFIELDAEGLPLTKSSEGPFQRGRIYSGGNIKAFQERARAAGDQVLFVGDHIYGDMLRSRKSSNWRTAMVLQELEHEVTTHDRLRAELKRLDQLDADLRHIDSQLNERQNTMRSLQKLVAEDDGGPRAQRLPAAKRTVKTEIEKLRNELRGVLAQHHALEGEIDHAFNPYWGPLFREGYEVSKFGEQVEAYACVYTSRVSNFRFYSPMQYFRGPRDRMPHER
jgi:5'-nucleotidase